MNLLARLVRDPDFDRKREFLAGLPLFRGIPNRDVGILFKALYPRVYHGGEILFLEGDIGRALFILESGKVELVKRDQDGRPQTLAVLGAGDYFGEMALLEERPRLASATALEETRVYMLYQSKLEALYVDAPKIALAIMVHLAQILSMRLRAATERLVSTERAGAPT